MKSKISLAILASVLFILITWNTSISDVSASDQNVQKITTNQVAPLAPNFTLKDLSGKTRSLKDYRGKIVLLNFTTTWCP